MPISLPSRLLQSFSITPDIPALQLTFLILCEGTHLRYSGWATSALSRPSQSLPQTSSALQGALCQLQKARLIFPSGRFCSSQLQKSPAWAQVWRCQKLAHRHFGPFEVVHKVGSRAYELIIPASMKVHDVFHVSLLKLYKHKDGAITVPPPALLPSGGVEFEVQSICAHKSENGKLHSLFDERGWHRHLARRIWILKLQRSTQRLLWYSRCQIIPFQEKDVKKRERKRCKL